MAANGSSIGTYGTKTINLCFPGGLRATQSFTLADVDRPIAEEKREIVGILYPHTRYEGTLPVYYTMPLLNKIEQLHPHAL